MPANIMKMSDKSRLLVRNILGSTIIKGLSLIVSLVAIPVYMRFFSSNIVLGVWFSILSILNWILTFDLGVGNGLRNKLAEALVENDKVKAKKYLSSAYFIIGVVSLLITIVGNVLTGFINWNVVLNIPIETLKPFYLTLSIRILFVGIMLQFFLRLIVSVMLAMQKTALSSLLSLVSQSLIIILLFFIKKPGSQEGLVIASVINSLAINLPLLIATVIVFLLFLRESRPNPKFVSKEYAVDVMKLGYLFFGIQIALLIINSINPFLIAKLYGPEEVVEYQIYYRLYALFPVFFSIITAPIWSSVTNEHNLKNTNQIKKIYRSLNILAAVMSGCSFLLVFFLQFIIDIWLKQNSIQVKSSYALVFALQNAVLIFIYSVTCIANGISELKTQIICNSLAAIVKIPLTYFAAKYTSDWIGIIIVGVVIMLPCLVFQPIALNAYFRRNRFIPANVCE